MAYAFNEPADSALWHTIFLHYDIENKSDTTYHDTYVGTYTNTKIGNKWDDRVGSDVQGGFYFGYNGEDYDDNMEPDGTIIDYNYGYHPPALGIMFLGGPFMDEDGHDNPKFDANGQQICDASINGMNFGDSVADNERVGMTGFMFFGSSGNTATDIPTTDGHFYNYMKSIWRGNTSCLYGGLGHANNNAVGPECKFMFPGDSDPCNWGSYGIFPNGGYNQNGLYWTDEEPIIVPGYRIGLGSSGPFTFKPGDIQKLDLAFVWARDYDGDPWSSVELLKEHCYYIKDKFEHEEDFFSNIESQKSTKNHLKVYPNPVDDELTIQTAQKIRNGNISVFNVNGKCLFNSEFSNLNEITINILHLKKGLYIIKLFDGLNNHTAKFIKN